MSKKLKIGDTVSILADVDDGPMRWTTGTIVNFWKRAGSFRTNATPEAGGPVVYVPGSTGKNKNINATWEQIGIDS